MSSLSTLRTSVRTTYLKIDPNAKVWDNNTLDYFINRWYTKTQEDFQYSIPECEWSTTITTTWWTQEYTKPSDFVRVIGFFHNTVQLKKISKKDTLRYNSSNTIPSSFYLYGSNIGLYPTPDNTYSLDLLYAKKLPKLTSTQDSLLDEDMEDLVVLWACYLMFLSVEKQVKATMCLAQYNIAKDSHFNKDLYDDDDITFSEERPTMWYRDDAIC